MRAFLCIFLMLIALVVPVLVFSGCRPVESPAQARAAITIVAEGVLVADKICATTAKATKDIGLVKACMTGYNLARPALVAAEASLNDGKGQDAACQLSIALAALHQTVDALAKANVNTPPVVSSAFQFASLFASQCKGA